MTAKQQKNSEEGECFILLGGNVGDVAAHFRQVEKALPADWSLRAQSPLYRSEAWGYESKAVYLNQVWRLHTHWGPREVLDRLLAIERQLGRVRQGEGYTDRAIDLDLLLYGNLIMEEEGLSLPHPRMHLRAFTLRPLLDLAPALMHPRLGLSFQALWEQLEAAGETKSLSRVE